MNTIPKRIRLAMIERDLTDGDVSYATGIHPSNLSKYKTGKNVPTAKTLRRLALALGVDENWLLGIGDVSEVIS